MKKVYYRLEEEDREGLVRTTLEQAFKDYNTVNISCDNDEGGYCIRKIRGMRLSQGAWYLIVNTESRKECRVDNVYRDMEDVVSHVSKYSIYSIIGYNTLLIKEEYYKQS